MVTDAFIHDKDTPKWIDYIFCDKFIFFHLAWLLCLFPEAAIRSCSLKEVLLKISSKTQRETPVLKSIKPGNFIKKRFQQSSFPREFCEIFKNNYSIEHLWRSCF